MSVSPERGSLLMSPIAGWRAQDATATLEITDAIRLRPVPGAGRPLVDAAGTFAGLADATGLAAAADGDLYVLDAVTPALWHFDLCERSWQRVPCIAGAGAARRQVDDPHGIALTPGGDLLVADTGNRRVQVFSTKGWVLRAVWESPEAAPSPWSPWDVAVRPDGGVLVTDHANGLVHVFDGRGRWRRAVDGSGDGFAPLSRPTHVAVDAAGNAYVVQDGIDHVVVLDRSGTPVERLERDHEADGRFEPRAVAAGPDGEVYVVDNATGELFQYGVPGPGRPRRPVVRCCVEGPCGTSVVVTLDGDPIVTTPLPTVESLRRTAQLEREGRYLSEPLDSRTYRCIWHRVVLDADVPLGTYVQLHTYTSDAPKTPGEIEALTDQQWHTGVVHDVPGSGPWDALVRGRPGRYLWLRLTIAGEGSRTPVVRSIRVTYPRASTLRFLPGIFAQDAESADFLDRFLSVFDRTLDDIADGIDDFPRVLDPMVTPAGVDGEPDFLTWLASWLGLVLYRHWPLGARRRLLAEAADLYAQRGTLAGLRRHLELYLGARPPILEHFRLRHWMYLGHGRLGERAELWGREIADRLQLDANSDIGSFQLLDVNDPPRDPFHVYAHKFTVFVPYGGGDEARRFALERIIELAAPAHAQGELRLVQPRFRVGHALVGMDTVIAAYPDKTVEGESTLGYDTVLGPDDDAQAAPSLEIGRRRVGWDTLID